MVEEQLRARGLTDRRVLDAMSRIPRHLFVPENLRHLAYCDGPLAIGENQTISQPYVVAWMTTNLRLRGDERVLEIGTGSGYQTAVLCDLVDYVYSVERFPLLASGAASILEQLSFTNVDIHVGDGSQGLPDMAPFDAIIVTAAAPSVPGPLCSQLSPNGGRMIVPVEGRRGQKIHRVTRRDDNWSVEKLLPVRFVPLLGRYGFRTPPTDSAANA
jgi:protein-L-isoaspartate(D-aspartate) O-methyltransferase